MDTSNLLTSINNNSAADDYQQISSSYKPIPKRPKIPIYSKGRHYDCGQCYYNLEISGRQNYCPNCHIEWCHMCNRNYEYFYNNNNFPNIAGDFCWNACLCATYYKCRFSEVNGVRVHRQNWLYCLLALLAVVTFPVWGLLYTLYFFGCHFFDAFGEVMWETEFCIITRIWLFIFVGSLGLLVWGLIFLPWFLLKIYFRGILLSIFYVPFKFAFVPVNREF